MYIVHVSIHVKPEYIDAFKAATLINVTNTLQEPGVARFDFLQQSDDPNRFKLVEVFRTPEDADLHKATAHYQVWRDTVAEMMAEPRTFLRYANIAPDDSGW